jgi:hypothetical protein
MATRLHLQNEAWNSVNVEAKVGDDGGLESRDLLRSAEWIITSEGDNIFWRRDRDPDRPDGTYTGWVEHACYPGDDKDEYERIT